MRTCPAWCSRQPLPYRGTVRTGPAWCDRKPGRAGRGPGAIVNQPAWYEINRRLVLLSSARPVRLVLLSTRPARSGPHANKPTSRGGGGMGPKRKTGAPGPQAQETPPQSPPAGPGQGREQDQRLA